MLASRARLAGREENYLGRLQEQSAQGIALQAGRGTEATLTPTREDTVSKSADGGGGADGGGEGETGGWSGEDAFTAATCPECFIGQIHKRLNSRVFECDVCGYAIRKGAVIRKGRRKEAARERAY